MKADETRVKALAYEAQKYIGMCMIEAPPGFLLTLCEDWLEMNRERDGREMRAAVDAMQREARERDARR